MANRAWRLMGHYNAETAAYSACAGTAQTSPYQPDFNGRLVALRTQASAAAATSLTEHVQFKLTCTAWKPNSIECFAQGNGIHTAPAKLQPPIDFICDQPIVGGLNITVEGRCTDGTDVTNEVYLYGLFEVI